ncbi:ribonuclease HI family protein [Candidatus Roizmanbacteria bacterium]|nr:ribonuclease HI family protein [Candidatus Roizmanbacteria bacterium]
MTLTVFTDGGSLNNPGPAAAAYLIYAPVNRLLEKKAVFLGQTTNNVAEYTALQLALTRLRELKNGRALNGVKKILCYADSLLLVNQLNGLYKIKSARLREFVFAIRVLESEVAVPTIYAHILREKNYEADALVKSLLRPLGSEPA